MSADGTLAVAVAVLAGGVALGVRDRWPSTVPLAVVVVAAVLAAPAALAGTLLDPERGPIGYANATAAFFVVAAGAALALHVRATSRAGRSATRVAAVSFAVVPWLNGSHTGSLASLVVLAGLHPGVRRLSVRWLAAIGWTAVVGTLAVTVTIALMWDPSRPDDPSSRTAVSVAGERAMLWGEALTLAVASPLTGVGAGQFGPAGTPATVPHQRYAHSEFLQLAAEGGAGVLVVALAALTSAFVAIANAPAAPDRIVAVLVLTAVSVHSAVDYVDRFPIVLAAATAIVVATATRPPSAREGARHDAVTDHHDRRSPDLVRPLPPGVDRR